jgi:hypothetical protein
MTEEISFEEACAGPLRPWFSGEVPEPDLEVTSAKVASAHAFVAGLNANAKGQAGVIRILVPDQAAHRSVKDHLLAFFERPPLSKLLSRTTPDTVELQKGVVLEITTNSLRLGRGDLITTISMVEGKTVETITDPRDAARAVCLLIHDEPHRAGEIEDLLGLPRGHFAESAEQYRQNEDARWQEWLLLRMAQVPVQEKPEPSVPQVPRPEQPYEAPQEDGVTFFSERWEQENALRTMMSGRERPPSVHYQRPRGQR